MSGSAKRAVVAACVLAGVGTGAAVLAGGSDAGSPKPPTTPKISLQAPERVAAGSPLRFTGAAQAPEKDRAAVMLQRKSDGRWETVARSAHRGEGRYSFVRIFDRPAQGVFRTSLAQDGKTVVASAPRRVTVSRSKAAGVALLPDLGAKKLTECAASEQPCFTIVSADGRRLLRFPMITVNVGEGPVEIHGYRSTSTSKDWVAGMKTLHSSGDTKSARLPRVVFYWAGDGHNHWHIRDFDYYDVLDAGGKVLRRGEKHGFCFEDNTTFRDWLQRRSEYPNVPQRPAYKHEDSCGEERPFTTSMVHGLSVGWADTYPTSLPDQNIDITGLPDGVYTVRVKVDGQRLVPESDESNNAATVKVRISGDKVSVNAASATGL